MAKALAQAFFKALLIINMLNYFMQHHVAFPSKVLQVEN